MGCAASIQTTTLQVKSPKNRESDDALAGELVVICKNRLKLDRDVRATLKLRATMITLTGYKNKYTNEPEQKEDEHIIWGVGGVVSKRGTVLEPGENRLEFDFPLEGKLREAEEKFIKPEELVKEFGKCTYIQYDYVLRAGSLQIQEFVRYLKLFPPGDNGTRVIDSKHEGISSALAGSIVGGIVGAL